MPNDGQYGDDCRRWEFRDGAMRVAGADKSPALNPANTAGRGNRIRSLTRHLGMN